MKTDWTQVALGELMLRRGGSLNAAATPDQAFELYSIPAHDRGGYEEVVGSQVGSAKQLVQPGDIMISKIVPHIRRARVVGPRRGLKQIASSEWIVFRTDKVDPRYLRHFLVSDRFHSEFMSTVAGVGGSLLRARPAAVANLTLPLPPIEEQRRIAAILDHSDELRQKEVQRLVAFDALERGLFQQMFGDLGPDSRGARPFRHVVPSIENGRSPVCESRPRDVGERGVLKLGAVTYGIYRPEENKAYLGSALSTDREVRSGDLLMTRKNTKELVGAVAYVASTPERLLLPDLIFRLNYESELVHPVFLQRLLMTGRIRAAVRGLASGSAASMPNISKARLLELPIPVPVMARQQEFVTTAEEIGVLRSKASVSREEADGLAVSLQARAFSGRL